MFLILPYSCATPWSYDVQEKICEQNKAVISWTDGFISSVQTSLSLSQNFLFSVFMKIIYTSHMKVAKEGSDEKVTTHH